MGVPHSGIAAPPNTKNIHMRKKHRVRGDSPLCVHVTIIHTPRAEQLHALPSSRQATVGRHRATVTHPAAQKQPSAVTAIEREREPGASRCRRPGEPGHHHQLPPRPCPCCIMLIISQQQQPRRQSCACHQRHGTRRHHEATRIRLQAGVNVRMMDSGRHALYVHVQVSWHTSTRTAMCMYKLLEAEKKQPPKETSVIRATQQPASPLTLSSLLNCLLVHKRRQQDLASAAARSQSTTHSLSTTSEPTACLAVCVLAATIAHVPTSPG